MFPRGMDVVLEYCVAPAITNDSFSKRTMSLVNAKIPGHTESVKWIMVFKLQYIKNRFSQSTVNNDGLSGNP